jgi:hypothetical protein
LDDDTLSIFVVPVRISFVNPNTFNTFNTFINHQDGRETKIPEAMGTTPLASRSSPPHSTDFANAEYGVG